MPLLDGTPQPLSAYAGKLVLVVNVASKCGFTPQYEGLEKLWRDHRDEGLVILGFPCNQFGGQEPDTAEEIAEFCSTTYQVSFPIFAKIEVNGTNADPLYKFLKSSAPGVFGTEMVKWNFTKFLVGRDGKVIERFGPEKTPEQIDKEIAPLLQEKAAA
ncbi:MAG TPA: glutathione peroxidase [Devosia sp.]|nr:glutathione peroxidase [Devosia sp.]